MNDSLEARLAAMPEIEADILPYGEWLTSFTSAGKRDCCLQHLLKWHGCDDECLHGSTANYYWHGATEPTAESLVYMHSGSVSSYCDECGHGWKATRTIHQSPAADFNEETERARLMPV